MNNNNNINPSKYLGNEIEYLQKVLNSDSWSSTSGSWCQLFEKQFSELIGVKYAVAMNSGTATLHAALEAIGVGPGDEVISPALTVFMDTSATLHANATPVYADIDPYTFNISPEEIRKKTEDQISSEMENLYKESLNLRFQKSSGQLENTSRINKVRKLIARMKTVLNERSEGK